MKTNLFLLFLLVVIFSCQLKKSDNTEAVIAETAKIDDIEDCAVDTVKATAIFWIDKVETKHCKEYGFRTIKAKVLIRENGKVDLLSFAKKQSPDVEKYIRHHLSKFQVTEKMFKGEYVQPGEQFVQLRCLWGMLKGK
ncbi:DUF4891 domain-containing protein [Bacteroides sp. AN502(2024)]|uniref:DUF4891 domain-containing protein n=1 Tax=Bacteroides sp. AN502(2024) TaxID=3160599 RepID=UPI003516DC19